MPQVTEQGRGLTQIWEQSRHTKNETPDGKVYCGTFIVFLIKSLNEINISIKLYIYAFGDCLWQYELIVKNVTTMTLQFYC